MTLVGVSFGAFWDDTQVMPFSLGIALQIQGIDRHFTYFTPIDPPKPPYELPIPLRAELELSAESDRGRDFEQMAKNFITYLRHLEDVILIGGGILKLAELLKRYDYMFNPDDYLWADPLLLLSCAVCGISLDYPMKLSFWQAVSILMKPKFDLQRCVEIFLDPKEYEPFKHVFNFSDKQYYTIGATAGERALLYLRLFRKFSAIKESSKCIRQFPKLRWI